MKVSQLISILQTLPSDATISIADCAPLDDIYFHDGAKRVSFDTEDNRPTVVSNGWKIIELTSAPVIDTENKNFYVTFPQHDALHCDTYTIVEAPSIQKARQVVRQVYGTRWAFIYEEKAWNLPNGITGEKRTQATHYGLSLRERLSA